MKVETVRQDRFVALDSWRGIAAMMVVLHHCPPAGWLAGTAPARNAWVFVDFFFVLSGFVIASAYYGKLSAGYPITRYMALRIGRLFPLHALVLLLFVFLLMGLSGNGIRAFTASELAQIARTLLFVQIFADPPVTRFNVPSWSVAAEFWVYFFAAVSMTLAKRSVFLWAAGAVLVSFLVLVALGPGPFYSLAPGVALVRAMFGFGIGMLVWNALGAPSSPPDMAPAAAFSMAEVATLAAIALAIAFLDPMGLSFGLPLLFAVAVGLFSHERGAISRWLRHSAFVRLGDFSYAIYISHMLAIMVAGNGIRYHEAATPEMIGIVPPEMETLLLLGAALMLAWVLHVTIECPARAWSRRIFADRHAKRAEAIVPTF